jgi:hypothetical protein
MVWVILLVLVLVIVMVMVLVIVMVMVIVIVIVIVICMVLVDMCRRFHQSLSGLSVDVLPPAWVRDRPSTDNPERRLA